MYTSAAFDPQHILIAFHDYQPELLINSLRSRQQSQHTTSYMPAYSDHWEPDTYRHYIMANTALRRTDDEALYMARHFSQRLKHEGQEDSVFELLRSCTETMLTVPDNNSPLTVPPLCRYSSVLRWRQLSHKLGQDLFTTAFLADREHDLDVVRENFTWPANIITDNTKLTQLLDRGISENHFHLGGSTRLFTLSWVSLMNHPDQIISFAQQSRDMFRERLNPGINSNPDERLLPWNELLQYGAFLRTLLYEACTTGSPMSRDYFRFDDNLSLRAKLIREKVELLRYNYGAPIPQANGSGCVLDYALSRQMKACLKDDSRLLAGERWLLYHCFCKVFDNSFTQTEKDLFYLYLLIKNAFRSELIQVNNRMGFQNFARYQGRKGLFWSKYPEYDAESIRLSLNASLSSGYIRSLEARVSPANSANALNKEIQRLDSVYSFAITGVSASPSPLIADSPVFYVLHFNKNRRELPSVSQHPLFCYAHARNSVVRKNIRSQARTIAHALSHTPYLRKRIRGIDACSNEIGCRPETFATEFRYLRSSIPCEDPPFSEESERTVKLHATYHAGEDFIDIVDGLRSIDEAWVFLELHKGDRLGHALALGIKPRSYYEQKDWKLVLPKQDLLDNLVWLLYRMPEFGISLPQDLETKHRKYAEDLMKEIGYDVTEYSLEDYYHAWWLRGDHPCLYETLAPCGKACGKMQCRQCPKRILKLSRHELSQLLGGYGCFLELNHPAASQFRWDWAARAICMTYHYDPIVKTHGAEIVAYRIDRKMASLLEQLQNEMQRRLKSWVIGIECNPSSNVLIGSFDKYRDHPLFRFNRTGIQVPHWSHEVSADLRISINTDDQGVFDTSLENEYACVAQAMEREVNENGDPVYNTDEINAYLNHLRIIGNSQTFHPKGQALFAPDAESYSDYCTRLTQSYQTHNQQKQPSTC